MLQTLKARLTAHKSDIRVRTNACALSSHASQNNHNIDFENTTILTKENNIFIRKFIEKTHINGEKHPINKNTDIQNLKSAYAYLLYLDE